MILRRSLFRIRLNNLGVIQQPSCIRTNTLSYPLSLRLDPRAALPAINSLPYSSSPESKEPEIYTNFGALQLKLSPPENPARSIVVRKLPRFAIQEDVERFFKEDGFRVERIFMGFDKLRGFNLKGCQVWFKSCIEAEKALRALQGASLFGHKVFLTMDMFNPNYNLQVHKEFAWGWIATKDPDPENAQIRKPLLHPPSDVFAPLRERRRVVFDGLPDILGVAEHPNDYLQRQIYPFLHGFNVVACSGAFHAPHRNLGRFGFSMSFDFATHEEAQRATTAFDGINILGKRIRVAFWQPSKKHLGGLTWDSGLGSVHFSGTRDQGSAVGTNFEEMQEVRVPCADVIFDRST